MKVAEVAGLGKEILCKKDDQQTRGVGSFTATLFGDCSALAVHQVCVGE